MAKQILKDQSVYLDGYDLTGKTNALALDYSSDLQDVSVFGSDSHLRIGGLKMSAAQVSGFQDLDISNGVPLINANDAFQFNTIGLDNTVMSWGAKGDAVGDVAYTMLCTQADIKLGGSVGDVAKFDAGGQSNSPLIRGTLMLNSKAAALTSTGNGTGIQLGAVTSAQRIYASMHVLEAGTGSVTAKLQSSATGAFAGEQTDRITFSAATALGAQHTSVAGAITDTYWRITYTITGGAPSFKLVFVVGIL